ncbi:uncharacterized protein [Paralichthys olivaceus]|uniref:uncharacterized protein isoform X2 n=1 Tax=Paralichthys olivaceus TaxID=8255 RepID=UPI003752A8D9
MTSWFHSEQFSSAADKKYHGLFNQGATCYLNSVLQVLFMTRDFREAVEKCTPDNTDTKCIDHQLKDVFVRLLKQTAHTDEITWKLGIDKVYEQQDAAECFEKILALTSSEASQMFHGELTRMITCSRCHTEKSTDGRFLHLPLELVDSNSEYYRVVHGIKEYFRTSCFSGDNQMYCEHCDAKSDATIECVMKDHPDVLVLLLKRFDFDYYYMSYVKNNRAVVFPCSLEFQQNQTYEVYAYVEHFGDLRGGHYTATIKSQDDERWYNFNDGCVTLLINQPFRHGDDESSESVYLLFYRKKKLHIADVHTQGISEVLTNGGSPPPAAGDDEDECPYVEQMTEREECKEMAEVCKEETRIKDNVSVGSAGVDPICNVEDQDNGAGVRQRKPFNDQECNEESSDTCGYLPDEKQEEDGGGMMLDEEEGGKAEAEDQAEEGRGLLSVEAQLEESVEDMDCDNAEIDDVTQGTADINQDLKPEASDRDAIHDCVNEKDEVREGEGRILNTKMDWDGGDEGLEKNKSIDGHAESQEMEDFHDARETLNEDQGDKQEQNAGNDEAEQVSSTKPYCSEGVQDQAEGRLDDVGQNDPEETIGVSHTTHEDVGVEEQAEENKDSSQSGTEKLRENEGGEGVEKMVNSQPIERAGLKDATAEGGGGSEKTILYVEIIEKEILETSSGVTVRTVRKRIPIEKKHKKIKTD